jgi:hypothetical protein
MVPMDPLWLVALFEQCQAANKAASVLDQLKEKKQPKEKKKAHLPVACSRDSNHRYHCHKNCNHHHSDQCDQNECRHHSHHQDDRHNHYPCHEEKDSKKKSYKKRDDHKYNHFKKKEKVIHNDHSHSLCTGILSKKGVAPCQGLLLAHAPVHTLTQAVAKGAM